MAKWKNQSAARCAALVALVMLVLAAPAAAATPEHPKDDSDKFFDTGMIPQLRIEINREEMAKLKAANRSYVRCTIEENKKTKYTDVGIKLKGAAGSFRDVDDRPALTINVDKFNKDQYFHALDKFHLNNSVQDETYLHELLCSDLFRAAGVPATRVTHARVWLNGRDLGFYVLKEGFDKKFLKRNFPTNTGNLYDGGFCQEIDAQLKRDAGSGPEDRADLKALVAACQMPDAEERWSQVGEQLDVDEFITFVAMELMTCHWDGYAQSRNNYRVYFDSKSKRASFLPHGMDQMFSDTSFSILNQPGAMVAATVMQNPEWRAKYRKRIDQLVPLFDPPDRLLRRVDEVQARLRPVLEAMNPDLARDHAERAKELKTRLVARAENLRIQNKQREPEPIDFDEHGVAAPEGWFAMSENDAAKLEEVDLGKGRMAYSIQCAAGQTTAASWRCQILLAQGRYRFEAAIRTKEVVAVADEKGGGAGVRISGLDRKNKRSGSGDFKTSAYEFNVDEPTRQVVLVAELRASQGQAWFDAKSLRLVRVDKQ